MTLYDLGCEYAESAEIVRARLKVLRAEYKNEQDPYRKFHIDRRIRTLEPMLTECVKMAAFLKKYYEPGFYIKNGPYGARVRSTKSGIKEDISGNNSGNRKGAVNTESIRDVQRLLCLREDDGTNSKRTRRK